MQNDSLIEKRYQLAKEQYSAIGVDVDKSLDALSKVKISLHCWQADDVGGFEKPDASLSGGGIQATGNYPGKARTIDELRMDVEKVLTLLPGNHRFNIHAIYGEFGGKTVDRDQIEPRHFQSWIDWAKKSNLKLDFNCTSFSHPKSNDGFSLAHPDKAIRDFWIEHVNRCRAISDHMGRELNDTCIHNIWIHDGCKDLTLNRYKHRQLLKESLDTIFAKPFDSKYMKDCLESKLFGIGSESYVVGSHEFYMGYCISNKKMITLDMGHFHPTESIADKVSSILQFSDEIMLHVSRGIRWDSDHVVIVNDDTLALSQEIVRANALNKMHFGLDFFDASINRLGAYVIGTRSTLKTLLYALLEPIEKIRKYEAEGKNFEKLALLEEAKSLPWGAVWDYYCMKNNVPMGESYISEIQTYEKEVLSKR